MAMAACLFIPPADLMLNCNVWEELNIIIVSIRLCVMTALDVYLNCSGHNSIHQMCACVCLHYRMLQQTI